MRVCVEESRNLRMWTDTNPGRRCWRQLLPIDFEVTCASLFLFTNRTAAIMEGVKTANSDARSLFLCQTWLEMNCGKWLLNGILSSPKIENRSFSMKFEFRASKPSNQCLCYFHAFFCNLYQSQNRACYGTASSLYRRQSLCTHNTDTCFLTGINPSGVS